MVNLKPPVASPVNNAVGMALSSGVKFSNDKKRLQCINSVWKSLVGAQIKCIIDLLLESKHDLKDKSQLCILIRKFPEAIDVADLEDAYPTVMEDLQALKAAGQIWLPSQEDIAYPNDPRAVIKVEDDLKLLYRGIELPCDMLDVEKHLQKDGMKPAINTTRRRAAAQVQGMSIKPKIKEKKHVISKRTKLTSTHLPELFQKLNS